MEDLSSHMVRDLQVAFYEGVEVTRQASYIAYCMQSVTVWVIMVSHAAAFCFCIY